MKYIPHVIGALLGLFFIFSASVVLFGNPEMPPIPEGTPPFHFMAAFGPTGYMSFVKVLELLGGILVAVPKTRNFGLLILGPILVNILAYHQFVAKDLFSSTPTLVTMLLMSAAALYLLFVARRNFAGLKNYPGRGGGGLGIQSAKGER